MGQADPLAFEWGVAVRLLPGERLCGDQYRLKTGPDILVAAVADGLGHGEAAERAAKAALGALDVMVPGEPVTATIERCHAEARGTRGAVMSLAVLDAAARTMTWVGVGNVAGILLRAEGAAPARTESLLLRGGVLGVTIPAVKARRVPLFPGDTLVFATDGVAPEFAEDLRAGASPEGLADRVLAQHARQNDDGLVLVVRYRGRQA